MILETLRKQNVYGINHEYDKFLSLSIQTSSEITIKLLSIVSFSAERGNSKCALNLILLLVYYIHVLRMGDQRRCCHFDNKNATPQTGLKVTWMYILQVFFFESERFEKWTSLSGRLADIMMLYVQVIYYHWEKPEKLLPTQDGTKPAFVRRKPEDIWMNDLPTNFILICNTLMKSYIWDRALERGQ